MTWGFSSDGDDAAERTSNQIIRLELEETGDNTGEPRLYVELRSNGHPINPLPWLAAETIKVSG
jgi:septal ring factor EnvC (AmiA/AmiB activator)